MKKFFRKFAVLLLVFVLGVAGTAFLMNSRSTDDRSDMNNPVLPEVMTEFGGTLSNLMHGYRQPMQADFVRECITPLDTTRTVSLAVDPHESEVKSLSYEIRSSDGTKVIENRKDQRPGIFRRRVSQNFSTDQRRSSDESGIFHADYPGYRFRRGLLLYEGSF